MKVLPGGKGANQASAAARLGVNVQLLGAVGEDSNADFLLSKLDEAGVDTADIPACRRPQRHHGNHRER